MRIPLKVAFEDAFVAVRDAFAAARRRLQDRERRMSGQVKAHQPRSPATEQGAP